VHQRELHSDTPTFALALRAALRQAPKVILVGEMRDRETVEIGLRAAITGHLVFSTLHTMSAVATVHRLLDMEAPGYMIAAAVHGIVAQRLLRRVCENCSHPVQADPHEAALLRTHFGPEAAAASFRSGSGCTYCNLTGYRGRIAVYELLEIDRTLTDAIRRGDLGRLEQAAHARADFVSLARRALELAMRGVTSVSEALAVVGGADDGSLCARAAADPLLAEALQADAMSAAK
jgi:MSHA biogenesis protein MshE